MKVDTNVKQINDEFSNIEVDLENEELAEILGTWADQTLAPASLHLFRETITSATNSVEIFAAIGYAIFNDIVVKALEETVREAEERDAVKK